MGIVKRQGAKHSLVQILGVAVGAISTLFIYPLNKELYGLVQFFLGTAFLLFPFANFGLHTALLKFYPRFSENREEGQAYFNHILFLSTLLYAFIAAILMWSRTAVLETLSQLNFSELGILASHYEDIIILTFLTICIFLLKHQAFHQKRIVIPTVIIETSLKLFLPILILVSLTNPIPDDTVAFLVICYYIVVVLALMVYLYQLKAFSFGAWLPAKARAHLLGKEQITYSLFSSLNKMGTVLAFRIDAFMITLILGAASNGLYYIVLFVANVIQIPFKSVNQITTPLISRAWENKDYEQLQFLYHRSSVNLGLISLPIFLFLLFGLDKILLLSPKFDDIELAVQVFLFLGLARVMDSVSSVNEPLLNFSPVYKYGLVFIIGLGVMNTILNYYLIQDFGLVGAAMASCAAYATYNLMKLALMYFKYGLTPWPREMITVFLLAALSGTALYLMQWDVHFILQLCVNAIVIVIVLLLPTMMLKVSPEFNETVIQICGRVPIFGAPLKKWMRRLIE
jgi:O-antigen/teichoic acid export membrane protein